MYNLLVSGSDEDWEGSTFDMDLSRVFEYTEDEIKSKYKDLKLDQIAELLKYPCLFAYETGNNKTPKYGKIKSAKKRQNKILVDYDIICELPDLTEEVLKANSFNLDIGKSFELRRTHWAVKDVHLEDELGKLGFRVPLVSNQPADLIDINYHKFDIALSFPGDARTLVEPIVAELSKHLKPHSFFYDFNYQSQLARPSLDILLQDIYGKRSKLIVVFLSENYERKKWCGVEFRAIKEVLMDQEFDKVMYIRMDDGRVQGVFNTDGYIDSRKYTVNQIVQFILERSRQQQDIRRHAFDYDIKITFPENGQRLANPVLVTGKFATEPPAGIFYCLEFNPQIGTYWPKNQIYFNNQRKDWTSLVSMGAGDDMDRLIYVVAVGNNGREVIQDHIKRGGVIGLNSLSDDMVIVDQCSIKLRK